MESIDLNSVIDAISQHSRNNKIIISFISNNYLPIFYIFYRELEKFKKENFVALSLDIECHRKLRSKDIRSIIFSEKTIYPHEKKALWLKRVELFHRLTKGNIDFIHTDSDAFWITDIESYFDSVNADISISIDYGIPVEAVRAWGFSCCCGLFQVKSTPNTIKFMDDYLKYCKEIMDDQVAINQVFLDKGIVWNSNSTIKNSGYIKSYDIEVDVITDEIVSRKYRHGLAIFHPFLPSPRICGKIYQLYLILKKSKSLAINLDKYWFYIAMGFVYVSFLKKVRDSFRECLKRAPLKVQD
jgi:hypothetical protein